MGASASKECFGRRHLKSKGNNGLHDCAQFPSLSVARTRCDAVAPPPPPLPPIGGAGAVAPPATTGAAASKSSSESKPLPEARGARASAISSPGPYEYAALDAKRLTSLDTHDGARIDITKQLSPYMVAIHSFWLGTSMLPDSRNKTYTFVTQVADENGLFMARVDPEKGSVDARVHRAFAGGLVMAKIQASVAAEKTNDQLLADLDFTAQNWTGNLKYGTTGGGLLYGMNYFQAITHSLSMGGEAVYVAANDNFLTNYTLRYVTSAPSAIADDVGAKNLTSAASGAASNVGNSPSSTIVGQYNPSQGMLSLNYKRVVTPNRVTLGAELQCSPSSLQSQVAFGAEFNLTRSKVALCVDGTGRIQSVLEAKLGMTPGSPTLNFSAEVDHGKDVLRFGYGLNIGG